jgi:hypothetical protein
MAFLMHICFANSRRLDARIYYFEYGGVRFKLIQNNPKKAADVLLTIVPSRDDAALQSAYGRAGEFLSALSWENGARIAVEDCGGFGVRDGFPLRRAQCRVFTFPQITYGGSVTGYHLSPIPNIETEEQRKALALMREARSANKVWLRFLFFWQILDIGGNPKGWVNRTYRHRTVHISPDEFKYLGTGGGRIGEFFEDVCRHAIAHIRRHPGKTTLRFDDRRENVRMVVSARIAERFAEHYVRTELRLTKNLHLMRLGRRGFPTYVDVDSI